MRGGGGGKPVQNFVTLSRAEMHCVVVAATLNLPTLTTCPSLSRGSGTRALNLSYIIDFYAAVRCRVIFSDQLYVLIIIYCNPNTAVRGSHAASKTHSFACCPPACICRIIYNIPTYRALAPVFWVTASLSLSRGSSLL